MVAEQDSEFVLETTVDGGCTVLAVHGEVDLDTAPRLERELRLAGDSARDLIVDLSATSFLDSSGIHALLRGGSRAAAQDARLILVCAPGGIPRKVLEITGIEGLYALCDTLGDAKRLAEAAAPVPPESASRADGLFSSLRRRPASESL